MIVSQVQRKIDKHLSDYKAAKHQCKEEEKKLQEAKAYCHNVEESRQICQTVAEAIQKTAHKQISAVVSTCLHTVFGEDYGFDIRFEKKRGRTEAKLLLLKNGHEISEPLDSDSGGVLDLAGFALRLSCLMLTKPKLRRILVLDEPFKFVSETYREKIVALIEQLSQDFQIQFVIVTHIPSLQAGKIISLPSYLYQADK